MNDNRGEKQRPVPQQKQERREASGATQNHRSENQEQKASPIERREWRGSGVCGDRHTD